MLLTLLSVFIGPSLALRGPYAAAATTTGPELPSYVSPINISAVCQEVALSVSSASNIFFPGTAEYTEDISHYSVASTQEAACSFEPGTPEDVGIALQILGRTRCPFAVKSGGHAMNPGFSSTPGMEIALYRFSNVTYNNITQTAKVGAGLIWDDVYAALEPYGVNVAGGRISGIGVGGLTLGGGWSVGYSWHTNQYGLTIDTVEAFELVFPNGTVTIVDGSQPDLFFGLKGGFNNFGIVTQFTLRTFPQTQVWGGAILYNESDVDQLTKATAKFSANNNDPKANVITSYIYAVGVDGLNGGINEAFLFYDAPSPPAGLFDDFLTTDSNATVFTRSFLSFVLSLGSNATSGLRIGSDTASVLGYPEDFLQFMLNESMYWGMTLPVNSGFIIFSAEPFLPSIYTHNTSASAWPGSRAFFSPLSITFAWTGNGTTDAAMVNGMKQSAVNLRAKAAVKEQVSLYGNYALADTPLEAMYGANVDRLRCIAKEVDPENVMGLTGGFKF